MRRLLRTYVALFIAFAYAPLAVMVLFSLSDSRFLGVWGGFTTRWYVELLSWGKAWEALTNSLSIALASAALSVALGLVAGYHHSRRGASSVMDLVMYLPIVMPEIAEALSLALFLYMIQLLLGLDLFGPVAIFLGHTAFSVSYAYVIIREHMAYVPRTIEDAALTLGAGPLQALVRIVVPLLYPGITAAFLISFSLSFDNFVKTAFTTRPGFDMVPLLIWAYAGRGRGSPLVNALGTVMLSVSLAIAVIYSLQLAKVLRRESTP